MSVSGSELSAQTVELLQQLIRNACVNDGTPESGQEVRNAQTIADFLDSPGLVLQRFEPAPGRVSIAARLEGSDPKASSLCLMGHTDVVPVDQTGWRHDPFGGELIDGEVWGRGAVDMLNQTASMAVAFRHFLTSGFRPKGDLIYFAVADEEAGSAYGARWMAENHPEVIAADYVLTENGGLHSKYSQHPLITVNVAEKGVAWRRLRIKGTPGHGSVPFKADNALVSAAGVIQRLADYRPAARIPELWASTLNWLGLDEQTKLALSDDRQIDELLAEMPRASIGPSLYSCSHTTFSPNLLSASTMKANVIPGEVMIEVDVRTVPGDSAEEVDRHLREALGPLYEKVEVEVILDDPASASPTATPLWDALERSVTKAFPTASLSASMIVGFTDARVFRELGSVAYGAGLFSPEIEPAEFASRFHGHDERIDVESLRLTTNLWVDVVEDLLA